MNLLEAAHSALAIKEFIEKDVVEHLVSIELNAAANTLKGLEHAVDKRAVYWSAINHLETVEQSLKSQLDSVERFQAAKQFIYISAIKALIYKYLNEDGLVLKCCDDSVGVVRLQRKFERDSQLKDILRSWNPASWFSLRRYLNSSLGQMAGKFDAADFWKAIAGRTESFELLSISADGID